ncbi:hypothetical protein, partial [Flavobacterium sp. LHD-85]|uniref:hypothetical protein n=1 Tax=Flavobacterium sp. LHD-85 TaxID=3071410 RepID=UPI0027E09B4C
SKSDTSLNSFSLMLNPDCYFSSQQNLLKLNFVTELSNIYNFEEREISTRSSTKIGDFDYGVTCEDFSFLEMTRLLFM